MTIKRAIQDYLEEQKRRKRQPKTLEWHQTALRLMPFQQYLQNSHQCLFTHQITESEVRSWLTFLAETPTARGTLRSVGTRESYARSARAFCQWLVRRRDLKRTPFADLILPKVGRPLTENGIALLIGRLRKRAGITRKGVNPSLLRDTFAVRYLQAGGDLLTLRELLGQEESTRVKRSLQMNER